MDCIETLKNIYENLNNIKFNLFCKSYCNKNNYSLIKELTCLLEESESLDPDNKHELCCCNTIIDEIICCICKIEEENICYKNYIYLSQLNKFKCILINLKTILCQLKCLCSLDWCIISKIVCIFIRILELTLNIISKLNNIKCLIDSHIECKCEILECLICQLIDDLNKLELKVSDLAQLVLEITSQNIINCTTCTIHNNCYNNSCCKNCCNCSCNEKCKTKLIKY